MHPSHVKPTPPITLKPSLQSLITWYGTKADGGCLDSRPPWPRGSPTTLRQLDNHYTQYSDSLPIYRHRPYRVFLRAIVMPTVLGLLLLRWNTAVFKCLLIYNCVCVSVCAKACMWQRITCDSQFSPPATWVLGIEVRSANLVASTFAELSYQPSQFLKDCQTNNGLCRTLTFLNLCPWACHSSLVKARWRIITTVCLLSIHMCSLRFIMWMDLVPKHAHRMLR